MTIAHVKNWKQFQHYKDRSPPWVKLHRGILDDFDFARLPLASKALAPLIWLLASESQDGSFEADPERLAFRIRWDVADVRSGLSGLFSNGFILGDSGALAERLQHATPERERETEAEVEQKKKEHVPQAARFAEFWNEYPIKRGKKTARDKWNAKKLDAVADRLIADVRRRVLEDQQWRGGFAPHASTYLQQERWEDELGGRQQARAGPVQQPQSKTMQGIAALEGMKHENRSSNVVPQLDLDRPAKAAVLGS